MQCSGEVLLTATGCARAAWINLNGTRCMIWFTVRLNVAVLHGELCDTICAGVLVLSSHNYVKIALLELCNKRPLFTSLNKDR